MPNTKDAVDKVVEIFEEISRRYPKSPCKIEWTKAAVQVWANDRLIESLDAINRGLDPLEDMS